MPMTHRLKCWPEFYAAIACGVKTFDIRINDRRPRYAVGDILDLHEYDDRAGAYTGRHLVKRVTYLMEGGIGVIPPLQGLRNGYVALGLGDS
jgi:Domain of unknown function (DUF3850)